MPENLPERAISDDFSSDAYLPDKDGIYRVLEYRRKDGTLYMKSTLSDLISSRMYTRATLTYFDATGTIPLHDVVWKFQYDINRKIISKRVE